MNRILMLMLVLAAAAVAVPQTVSAVPVGTTFTYQGQLIEGGGPANGNYDFRLFLYDAEAGGSQVGAMLTRSNVPVLDGLVQLELDFGGSVFQGEQRWLEIGVRTAGGTTYVTLSPRQPVTATPYAMHALNAATVNPHSHFGQLWSGSATRGLEIVNNINNNAAHALRGQIATGSAVRGEATGGFGVYGYSASNIGVSGVSDSSWGGYFASSQGLGLRVESSGTDHYDHGALITSVGGWGVLARSANNQALRGEAGNVTGISQPLGAVGVVGIGSNRGSYGSSSAGIGIYGVSNSNYGVWGTSTTHHGVTGRTSRADNNYGFYSPDNLYSLNINMAGASSLVVANGGQQSLRPGDVVVVHGVVDSKLAGLPKMLSVARAGSVASTGVAGVVQSRYNLDVLLAEEDPDSNTEARDMELTPAGEVPPGEYLLIVVFGLAEVQVDAKAVGIAVGDVLAVSGNQGQAVKAGNAPAVGTIVGKALEPLGSGNGRIHVLVTLQ